ncbi:DUF4386 domain-containing protein [Larkinella soli]|uniref:DUF4386 domain-containing protein n=1 Tax=Larkinella soli TaxID=1770527 RepID=UPI000FFBB800|nr:DUF4386 domain-containing protein [Larkinella soli]
MKTSRPARSAGTMLLLGSTLVLIPYTLLTLIFDYPAILRESPGVILTRFQEGGPQLIAVWWAFALTGLPLLAAFVRLGQLLENRHPLVRLATTFGLIGGVAQIVGLLRWTFVVPVLARSYVTTDDPAVKATTEAVFQAVHQFGGVLLGESVGQLFTIGWTVLTALALRQLGWISGRMAVFGYTASGVYLLAQSELFATVLPGFPEVGWAGLAGSTLWLVWMAGIGLRLRRPAPDHSKTFGPSAAESFRNLPA